MDCGIFIRKSDENAYKELCNRHSEELNDAINSDVTGEGFIKDMFGSELLRHKNKFNINLLATIQDAGFSVYELNNKCNLKKGWELAINEYLCNEELEYDLEEYYEQKNEEMEM